MPASDGHEATHRGLEIRGLIVDTIGPLDLHVLPGQIACLSGPSGAGKTRLLRAIADLDPHQGTCRLDARLQQAMSAPAWRTEVAYLPAESRWWAATVNQHLPPTIGLARIARLASALALTTALLDAPIERLSSGERQRGALLRLLAHAPRVLLLDEPTANLDDDNIARVETVLTDYCQRQQVPVLWVSHDSAQRQRLADQQLTIDTQGQIINQIRRLDSTPECT